MRRYRRCFGRAIALFAIGFLSTSVSQAESVIWTDWTSGTPGDTGSATGTLNIDGTPVTVSYSGEIAFIQTDGGRNYWNPSTPYISATVPNAPSDSDIIALSKATSKTITFSEPIMNPLFAVVSLNGNGYQFDHDFEILSYGYGYWGDGTLTKATPGSGIFQLNGTGEPHGVIEFQGTFSSITWTSLTEEYWNGFTIGVRGLAPAAVPEPSSAMLLGTGLVALVGGCTWRRKKRVGRSYRVGE